MKKKLSNNNEISLPDHRGRIQSQSDSMDESEAWSQDIPLEASEGIDKAKILEYRHNKKEKKLKMLAFKKAREFIIKCKENGGVTSRDLKNSLSFPVRNDRTNRRVDIEVRKGIAFIPSPEE